MSQVASRYARALAAQLEKDGAFEAHRPVLAALARLPEDAVRRLDDPTVPLASRESALRTALGGPSDESLLGRFVSLLARRRRLGLVDKICQIVLDIDAARAGLTRGTVHSHLPLERPVLERIEAGLSGPGRTVRLENTVDPSILGGFRVHLESSVLDATINNQLQQARKALLSA